MIDFTTTSLYPRTCSVCKAESASPVRERPDWQCAKCLEGQNESRVTIKRSKPWLKKARPKPRPKRYAKQRLGAGGANPRPGIAQLQSGEVFDRFSDSDLVDALDRETRRNWPNGRILGTLVRQLALRNGWDDQADTIVDPFWHASRSIPKDLRETVRAHVGVIGKSPTKVAPRSRINVGEGWEPVDYPEQSDVRTIPAGESNSTTTCTRAFLGRPEEHKDEALPSIRSKRCRECRTELRCHEVPGFPTRLLAKAIGDGYIGKPLPFDRNVSEAFCPKCKTMSPSVHDD